MTVGDIGGLIFVVGLVGFFLFCFGLGFVNRGGLDDIRPLLNWIHRITAPPRIPAAGDFYKDRRGSPFERPVIVTGVKDGWVQYRVDNGGPVNDTTIRIFLDSYRWLGGKEEAK
jgi:hypothetical protein